MDEQIADAINKNLITIESTTRIAKLHMILMSHKDMSKLNPIELNLYWVDYIDLHRDYAGFIYDEEDF